MDKWLTPRTSRLDRLTPPFGASSKALGMLLLLVGSPLLAADVAPAAHFTFNRSDATVVTDESGAVKAELHGSALVSSPRGLAVRMDGEDDWIDFGTSEALRMDGSFSIAIWVKVDPGLDANTTRLVFGDRASRSVQRNFNIKLDKYQRIHFEWGSGEAYGHVVAPAETLGGGWRHLVCVCDAERQRAALYVDGKQVGQAAAAFGATQALGDRFQSGGRWGGGVFSGEIDDIRLYRRALSAEEVGALFAEPAGGPLPAPKLPEPAPPVGQAGPLDRSALVSWYTFEEGTGEVLKDHSGNGYDGRIRGAEWTQSPWGGALRFDGKDDTVNLGRPQGLNLSGDLTIEAWLRTTRDYPLRRQPLIIGMNESWAKERNYNLRIDNMNRLRFEWGDGSSYSAVTHPAEFLDGGWRYVAIVVDSGHGCHVYADGRLVHTAEARMPITARPLEDVTIGGWSHGFLRGEIAELRLFNRALGGKEIWCHAGFTLGEYRPVFRITPAYDIRRGEVICDVFVAAGGERGLTVGAKVLETGSGRELASIAEPLAPGDEPVTHRNRRLRIAADMAGAEDVQVSAELRNAAGDVLGRAEAALPYAGMPDWVTARAGVTDAVLPPYTPCVVSQSGERVTVNTWGRRHVFAGGPLLATLHSAGADLLSAPTRVVAVADGGPIQWAWSPPVLVEAKPNQVAIRQQAVADDLRLALDTVVEYDGLMRTAAVLTAARPTRVDGLALEIPMPREQATLLYAWRGTVLFSGALNGDVAEAFTPILWVGNERRGLSWVAESDQYWSLAEPGRAIEVRRVGNETILRLNLVTQSTELVPDRPWTYRFGLQGTPVRPMDRTYWDLRIHRQPPYGHELTWPEKTIRGQPALRYYAENGARALIVWRWWNVFSYMLPIGQEAEFPGLVAAMHKERLQVLPYTIGFLISEKAPEFAGWRDEFLQSPVREFPIATNRLPGLDGQVCYQVCPQGYWTDFAVAMAARCMDEYGVDGVYLDTTVRSMPCSNETHGCGYVRPDGSRAPTYPVFATRELIKRLCAVVKARKADGLVDVHPFDCVNVPALAFADGMWIGEHLAGSLHKPDALPLDRFRAEFMGHNLGIPADLLYYKLREYDPSVAIALLHDVPVRCEKDADFDIIAQIYRIRETFGCREAQFFGYWENADLVELTPSECYTSLWRHPRNGVLAVVSNLSRADADITIRLDGKALGLGRTFTAEDARTEAVLPVKEQTFTVALPSQRWSLVWLRPKD